jgi:hypothetical protein
MADKKIPDRVAGKTKQIVAEIIGDGELAEEGKEQAGQQSDRPKPQAPDRPRRS